MEAIYFFEISVDFSRTTGRYISEDGTLKDVQYFALCGVAILFSLEAIWRVPKGIVA
jgi:hypothetical protein